MIRKIFTMVTAFTLVICAGFALAAETATPKEAKAKVEAAVKLLAEKGQAAFPLFRDRKGDFIWKDCYIVVGDLSGKLLLHPNAPKLEGTNMMKARDAKGNLFQVEMVGIAKKKGRGWMEYWWVNPATKKVTQKVSYIVRVPGRDWLALAGVWNMSKAQAEAAVQ